MQPCQKDFFSQVSINTDVLTPLHTGIAIFDKNALLVFANEAYLQMYNLTGKEYIGISAKDLFVTATQGIMEVLKTGENNSCTSVTVDGFYGVTYRFPIRNEVGEIIGCITENISVALDKTRINEIRRIINELETQGSPFSVAPSAQTSSLATFETVVGESAAMRLLKQKGSRFAHYDESILILGENGTGKDLIAQAIHSASSRRSKNYITVNCAALPYDLIESELFGYEAGAFTGASSSGKKGKFELAEGGTIFLDEIGELPLKLQAKLLRVLENHEVQKLGSPNPHYVDFRLLSATNRNLEQLVAEGRFREDLFYRLNLFELVVPPLRERLADIPLLAYSIIHGLLGPEKGHKIRIEKEVLSLFCMHHWRGNVRELRNVVTYALYSMGPMDTVLGTRHLPERFFNNTEHEFLQMLYKERELPVQSIERFSVEDLSSRRDDVERECIVKALQTTHGNKLKAAKMLKIARSNLYKKIIRLNINVDDITKGTVLAKPNRPG
ncbi:sigma 54-interacting transcriptional regulator [uncultured Desulfovibrio sp.]|uniref:sigma-54 interaction domain-containing protein n=1 Tax=uncultured Desulfovibrio sp. TaxID=167968 RepID=UPI00262ADF78|nr:sigma 54-interacting transcriptional regulator [uncultured Desulfovibrio sp.]